MIFEQQVKLHYNNLADSEKIMLQFILKNKEKVINSSIVELGELLLSSKSSVLRLAKKLGFQGFAEMKYMLKESLQQTQFEPEDLVGKVKYDISRTFHICEQTNMTSLLTAMKDARLVFLFATGFSQNNFLKEFSKDLLVSGRSNILISGETNLALSDSLITNDDLIIIAGLSGETPGLREIIPILKLNNVPIAAITQIGKNYLQDNAQYNLYFESAKISNNSGMDLQIMIGLNVTLNILLMKYHEFVLYDE